MLQNLEGYRKSGGTALTNVLRSVNVGHNNSQVPVLYFFNRWVESFHDWIMHDSSIGFRLLVATQSNTGSTTVKDYRHPTRLCVLHTRKFTESRAKDALKGGDRFIIDAVHKCDVHSVNDLLQLHMFQTNWKSPFFRLFGVLCQLK